MAAPYATWRGLTDRRFSSRHLPPDDAYTATLPDINKVVQLFKRGSNDDQRTTDTSLLFPFFAQWFSDSFLRTKWSDPDTPDPIRNESNHEIDLCQIYGPDEEKTTILRAHERGRLKSQELNGQTFPPFLFAQTDEPQLRDEYRHLYTDTNYTRAFREASNEEKRVAFAVGLEHGNLTVGNTLMNTLFLREHNRIAAMLTQNYESWKDERVFQTARNVNIVLLLKIVIGDYIRHITPVDFKFLVLPGAAERERWYRANWVAVEFGLLYRWHELIPPRVEFNGTTYGADGLRHNNRLLLETGIDQIVLEASRQRAGRIGLHNTPRFLECVRRDGVEMARECRLMPYNSYRRYYGLERVRSFQELTGDRTIADELEQLYSDVDKLEWFVGIFAEKYGEAELMGELMVRMVGSDAFTQALTNPLLAQAVYNEDTFSEVGLSIIEETETLADVVCRNTGIPRDALGAAGSTFKWCADGC